MRREDLEDMFLSKGPSHRKCHRSVLVGPSEEGLQRTKLPKSVSSPEMEGTESEGSEVLVFGGMQAKARGRICQDFERNNS